MHHHQTRKRVATSALVAVAVVAFALGGCGGGEPAGGAPAADVRPPARGQYLSRAELVRELSNDFRQGLYRLAVMSQPGDDAADLGQPLPTGKLDRVRCTPSAERRLRCAARWQTVGGRPRTTRYAVRLRPDGCFEGFAQPALHARYDSTINTYSEHPLNVLLSPRRGC